MKINILHRIKITVLVFILSTTGMFISSCNDFLNIDSNHAASEEQQWTSLEDTRAALMGIYGLMRSALAENNTHWVCGDLRMGDFSIYNRVDLKSVTQNELSKPYDMLQEIANWNRFYKVVNAAAVFIEKAPQAVDHDRSYSEENLKYDIAQAKTLRAFAYFYMVRIWGDVPLITQSYDNGSFPKMARTKARTVINYAKGELLEAVQNLPYLYGASNNLYYGQSNTYWKGLLVNKLSGYAILAHIAAWEGNYADVESYTANIMAQSSKIGATFTDISNLTSGTGIFSTVSTTLNGSRILGFNFDDANNESTQSGHIEQLTLAAPLVQKAAPEIYISKDSLASIFDDLNDKRFGIDTTTMKYYANYIENMNSDIPIFSKVKVIQDGNSKDGDYAVFGSSIIFTRLEEIALLRAEALVALNRGAEAIVYYNQVRMTRGFAVLSYKKSFGSDDKKLLRAIFEERRKELMGEGWRWYDLIRRQKLLKDNVKMAELIEKGGIFWPIAQDVLSANPMIEQNDYWK